MTRIGEPFVSINPHEAVCGAAQIAAKRKDDELPEEEQQEIIAHLEDIVASANPADLRLEIARLSTLIDHAMALERREIESKLVRLKGILTEQGVFSNPTTKLLVFTEHKDSLDFLVGDGQDGRPYGKLREWA